MSELHPILLTIQQPSHGQVFVGAGATTTVSVPLSGRIDATAFPNPAALFRRWYSSLSPQSLATSDQGTAALAVGSHVVTYTVKDKNEDGVPPAQLEALFKSIRHMGAAGGPPAPSPATGKPCVVHVLVANMLAPGEGAVLSKAGSVLEAEAPLQWGKYVKSALAYPERDPSYHAVNKVHYRWLFRRVASPGEEIELTMQDTAMVLIPPGNGVDPPPRLRYAGPLPADLIAGEQYTIVLRVEHVDNPAQGHVVSRKVRIAG